MYSSMAEVTSSALKEEKGEEDIELELGLSIGGGFRKPEESRLSSLQRIDLNGGLASSRLSSLDLDSNRRGDDLMVKKREMLALRRQEARRKREEKQMRRETKRSNGDSDDKMWLEARKARDRVRDRESKVNEANLESMKRECKNDGDNRKRIERGSRIMDCEELTLIGNHPDRCFDPTAYNASSVQHPCSLPVQYVSRGSLYAFPYVMPCWASAGPNTGHEKNVFRPDPNVRGFQPFRPHKSCGRSLSAVSDGVEEQNGTSRDAENKDLVSNGSPLGHSSSALSDHQSSSHQDGSSSDTRSHISNFQPVQTEMSASAQTAMGAASETPIQFECNRFSNDRESTKDTDKAMDNAEKKIAADVAQSIPSSPKESLLTPHDPHKPIISTPENSTTCPSNKSNEKNHGTTSLLQMPCVFTTGDGPNGKTVTGFLYRYTKSEVTIVCVCHGSSFSPAEFVRHAGGTDTSDPLRHITVVPFAFGS